MKDMKFSIKIGLGFSALLLLIVALGATSLVQFGKSQNIVASMNDEYLPELDVSSDLAESIKLVMFEVRGFVFTSQEKYWEKAKKALEEVSDNLGRARTLADQHPNLVKLRESVLMVQGAFDEYRKLADKAVALDHSMDKARETLAASAESVAGHAHAFLKSQNSAFSDETRSEPGKSSFDDRLLKYALTSEIIESVGNARSISLKAQAQRNSQLLGEAAKALDGIVAKLDTLKASVRKEADLEQIGAARSAAVEYQTALTRLQQDWTAMDDVAKSLLAAGDALDDLANQIADEGLAQARRMSEAGQIELNLASKMMVGGVVLAILLGAAVAVSLTRAVTKPLLRTVAYADSVSQGHFDVRLDVEQKDEVGQLAEALRLMVAGLKKELGFANGVRNGFTFPCAVMDTGNRLLWTNAQMVDALEKGGAPEDYVGMVSGEFFFRDAGRKTVSQRALEENKTMHAEIQVTTDKGSARIMDVTSTPFRDMDGVLLGTVAIWYDLTPIREQQGKIQAQAEKISQAASQLEGVVERLTSSSEELSAQVEQSSRGAEVQKERVGETATAMEEMNATVLEVAKNASQAADGSDEARKRAQEGAAVVQRAVEAIGAVRAQALALKDNMDSLGQQAEGIGRIMEVINDIADQTNLLALNAAIEAARAGEAGRGFAVVADEVRKLAEKTMTAIKEVGESIAAIQRGARENIESVDRAATMTEQATALANESGVVLQGIVTLVERASDQVRSIATASEQQSAASEQINRSVEEISRVSSETAEAMTESAQAVIEMANQSQEIRTLVHRMRVS